MTKPIKISRSAIKQAIKETPIEHILVGHQNADKVRLTKKQKDFAKAVAEGKPKAQAYREAYNSQAKPATQSNEGHKLTKNPAISAMIEAFQVANEAREYLIPAQIRTMAIQNLVGIAIDEGEKTSNKLKALELIGKMSEVALFTDRKELIHTNNSADIKTQLLEGLRQAFSNSRQLNDLAKRKAESLLIELEDARTISDDEQTPPPFEIDEPATPPTPDAQILSSSEFQGLHSNPHKRSSPQTDADLAASLLADLTPPADEVTISLESDTCVSIRDYPNALEDDSEGVGVLNPGQSAPEVLQETPPVNISNKKG
jgi:hypothetical protein